MGNIKILVWGSLSLEHLEKGLWVDGLEIQSRPVGDTSLGVTSVKQVTEALGMDVITKCECVD